MIRQFLREWAVLLAVFAMVLAPLGAAVARGLSTSERIAIAAGLTPPTLCLPGGKDGLASNAIQGCDHCLPVLSAGATCPSAFSLVVSFAAHPQPADTGPSALLAQVRLPPATGPPSA